MSIWNKLVMAWKGRAVIAELSQVSKGWKTLAFWISFLGSLITFLGALKEVIPPEYALLIGTGLTAFYNILRGVQKSEAPGVRPWFKTTEFWMGAGQQIQNALLAIQTGDIATAEVMKANVVLSGVMAIARDLSNMQPGDGSVPLAKEEPKA